MGSRARCQGRHSYFRLRSAATSVRANGADEAPFASKPVAVYD